MSYIRNLFDVENIGLYNYRISMTIVDPRRFTGVDTPGALLFDTAVDARFSIENLEHILVLGNGQARTSLQNKFNITINEPNGSVLMDLIRSLALQQGIRNHLRAIYIIEISFPGRDVNTNQPREFSSVFRYPVTFTQFSAQITEKGTQYTIEAIELSSSVHSILNGVARSRITFQGETVGEVIEDMQNKLNQAELSAWYTDLSSSVEPNGYTFEFGPNAQEWANFEIEQTTEGLDVRNISMVDGKIQFEMNPNSNIHDVIGVILRCTREFKQILTFDGGTGREAGHQPSNTTSDRLRTHYKVIPNVTFGEFDQLMMDYTRQITFRIVSFIHPEFVLDPSEYNSTMDDDGAQRSMIQNLRSQGLLRKRYDYIFTGKNTEVLNLDLKLDQAYFLLTAPFGGQLWHDRVAPNLGNDPAEIREKIRSIKAEIASDARLLRDDRLPGFVRDQAETRLGLNRGRLQGFIGVNNLTGIDIPMRSAQGSVDPSLTTGPESDTVNQAVMVYAASIANLESSADLLTIELQIRGDPYWLGQPNSFFRANQDQSDIADYEIGGSCFFLKVNLPVGTDANGQRIPQEEYSITGVYRVINVINQFRGGQFIQYLKAVRVPTINTSSVIDELDTEIVDTTDDARAQTTRDALQFLNTDGGIPDILPRGGPEALLLSSANNLFGGNANINLDDLPDVPDFNFGGFLPRNIG
jgi:hypothetical protein